MNATSSKSRGKPRIKVIGAGHWGKNHLRVLSSLGVLVGVSDQDMERAQHYASLYGVDCQTPDELFTAPDCDAIVIATPAESHYHIVKRGLEANLNVLVEKPISLDIDEAKTLVAIAEEKNLILAVGHVLRYHSAFQEVKNIVRSGNIGKLRYIYSNRLNLGRVRTTESSLWSFAPHDVSMILDLVEEMPIEVKCTGSSFLQPSISDVTMTHMAFDNGIKSHIFVSWLHPFKEHKLVTIAEKGMIVFDDCRDWNEKVLFFPYSVTWHGGAPVTQGQQAIPIQIEPVEPLLEELRVFVSCVELGKPPPTDGHEGVRVLSVLMASEESMLSGSAVFP